MEERSSKYLLKIIMNRIQLDLKDYQAWRLH